MLSTSGDEVIQVASPSKNFFTLALPAARQLDRGERKSACVGALFWIIRACAIVVGLCRGVKTFLVAKRLRKLKKSPESNIILYSMTTLQIITIHEVCLYA